MKSAIYFSDSPKATFDLGRRLAAHLTGNECIALTGDLGAGKTQMVKGFCAGLGIRDDLISSPTFSIVNEYLGRCPVYHFDFYRIEKADELWDIGIEDYFSRTAVKLVEWAELFPEVLPKTLIRVHITEVNSHDRKIEVFAPAR